MPLYRYSCYIYGFFLVVTDGGQFSMDNIYMGIHDCVSEDPDDLSFNRGDVMYIIERIDMNWWMGFLNGKVGLVPCNFLTEAFEWRIQNKIFWKLKLTTSVMVNIRRNTVKY